MATLDLLEELNVLPQPHTKMLEDHMARQGDELLRQHPYPQTLEQWQRQRATIRERLIESLGGLSEEKCDLNPRLTGTVERDGYRVEKVLLETRPNWYAGVNVYLPADMDSPAPGILCPHGHWNPGKISPHVQARCATLARRGYVALALDMVGYGEREFMEHRPTFYLFAAGWTLAGLLTWDNMRAIDYLCSRPEVDGERIGCTGASGGGNQTTYVSALDDRIKAAVPVCSVEVYQDYFRKGHCTCETVPGVVTYADQPHILGLVAPRALLLLNGILDGGFPIMRAREAYDRLLEIYKLYDPESLGLAEIYTPHGYERRMREAACGWFDRWLKGGEPKEVVEEHVWVEHDRSDTLLVGGREGLASEKAVTIPRLYDRLAAEAIDQARKSAKGASVSSRRAVIESAFGGFPSGDTPLQPQIVDTIEREDCAIEKLAFRGERDIIIPCLLLRARPAQRPQPACVFLSPDGKSVAARRWDVWQMLRAGWTVLAADLRGVGETSGGARGEQWALIRGFTLGRHIFGQRVWDVMRCIEYLESRDDIVSDRICVWGEEESALLALYAAAMDDRVAGAACDAMLSTYRSDSGFVQPPTLFPRNILKAGDVADVAALVAPRPLLIANAVDPSGDRLTEDELPATFEPTTQAYRDADAAASLRLVVDSSEAAARAIVEHLGE